MGYAYMFAYRLFRTLPLEARLTSLVFSPEGAALYAGTEDGRVLVLDLRALDKPPKPIIVNEESGPVVCMAVQVSTSSLQRPREALSENDREN